MVRSRLVKDVMIPIVRLATFTLSIDALRSLIQARTEYGVVCDESGSPTSIISRAQLRVAKPDEFVQALATHIPYPVPVHPDDSLSSIVQMLAENTTYTYDSTDIIVKTGDKIEGIVPHQAIEHYIWGMLEKVRLQVSSMNLSRSTGDPWRGPPPFLKFRCSICYKVIKVEFRKFNRNNPPVCHNQPMQRIN
jgi:CBS domain-containing protein